ncbi:hypothetical protein [Burkholderia ambifaria]|uniref:hypothetical protein n=1 Tax=Burkholderia ambifaria TaxID=152480 RepID=UPI0015886D73|nr:hypothetical protein [Burkholderia ambifaria]
MAAVTAFGTPAFGMPALTLPTTSRSAPASRLGEAAAAVGPVPAKIEINIHPQPGMDPQAIARAVAAAFDRRERAKRARTGSRLSD